MIVTKHITSIVKLFGRFVSEITVELVIAVTDDNVCALKTYWIPTVHMGENETIVVPGGIQIGDDWYWNRIAGKLAFKAHVVNFWHMFKYWAVFVDYTKQD